MSLQYENYEDIALGLNDSVSDTRINQALKKLLANDQVLNPTNGFEPVIWECKWYSNPNQPGYSKGTAVWINTEDLKQFTQNNSDQIYRYASENTKFRYTIQKFDPGKREIFEMYESIVSGYYDDDTGVRSVPLYYLGDIHKCAQIMVSTKDNNKDTPDTLSSWKCFFLTNSDKINPIISSVSDMIMNDHIARYHMGLSNDEDDILDQYANKNLNNIDAQIIKKHNVISSTGFDYVDELTSTIGYDYTRHTVSVDTTVLTGGYELTNMNDYQSFRINDYDVILNGYEDDIRTALKYYLSNTINYKDLHLDTFIDTMCDNVSSFGDITFQLSNASVTGIPFQARISDWNIIGDYISDYSISKIYFGKIDYTFTEMQQISSYSLMQHYKSIPKGNELSITVSEYDNLQDDKKILYSATTYESDTPSISTYTILTDVFSGIAIKNKSGILVNDGFLFSASEHNEISFMKPYDYSASDESFYGIYNKINDTLTYDSYDNLACNSRYVVSMTPVCDTYDECNSEIPEIIKMENTGMQVMINSENHKFMYDVCGIKVS